MTASSNRVALVALLLVLLTAFPVAYVEVVDAIVSHNAFTLIPGLQDNSFAAWTLVNNTILGAGIQASGGNLTVSASGNFTAGVFLHAQRVFNTSINLARFHYLSINIHTGSLLTAAEVILRISPKVSVSLLLKTYADRGWHNEIIDLSQFSVNSKTIFAVELGWSVLANETAASASFSQLSFNRLS